MLRSILAAGVLAGGLFVLSAPTDVAVAAPTGLADTVETPASAVDVVRRGHGGGHLFRHGGRRFGGWHGRRHWGGGRHWGYRRHRGRNLFLYGALPFIGYGAYSGGYYSGYSGCGRYWRRYQYTGSRYWYRRWRQCRAWY